MTVQKAILTAMEEVLGLEEDDLIENLDLDLFESGLVDSLAIVSLISVIEGHIGGKIAIKQLSPEDFKTINKFTAAIQKQVG
ncbi:MAG: phosphopantetheine-binding protein [Bacillota bacterium]|nr:phosphopantetheine-binding protein [Bacillota bacterium]